MSATPRRSRSSGRKPEADLDRGRDRQDESEQSERDREVLREGAVAADTRARSAATATRTGTRRSPTMRLTRPLRDQHARPARPRHLVLVNLARRGLIDRQRHRRVPQRARTQQIAAIIAHLPVQSRKRIGEARIGRRPRNHKMPLRIDVDAGKQLLEMDVEILGERAGDVTLEQQDQAGAGDDEREQDRDDPAGDEPQPQRIPSHPGTSGIR